MDWAARVASDVSLRCVLQAARAWGVSPRRFSGWEPARTLIYNQAGQLVRVETEPEWDDEGRAMVLALADYEAQLCPEGHYLPESTKPENEDRYESGPATRCHQCTATHRAAERYAESPQASALLYSSVLKPQPTEETATDEAETDVRT